MIGDASDKKVQKELIKAYKKQKKNKQKQIEYVEGQISKI